MQRFAMKTSTHNNLVDSCKNTIVQPSQALSKVCFEEAIDKESSREMTLDQDQIDDVETVRVVGEPEDKEARIERMDLAEPQFEVIES